MTKDELRALRKASSLTQAELASKIGYSRQAVIHWENGTAIPANALPLIMSVCVAGQVAPKETEKQRLARESNERAEIKNWTLWYRSTRAFYRNHNETMALFRAQGHVIPQCAYAAIVAEFPDILSDPGGDHPMNKSEALAAVGLPIGNET